MGVRKSIISLHATVAPTPEKEHRKLRACSNETAKRQRCDLRMNGGHARHAAFKKMMETRRVNP
jgi:hypothetical protein